MIFLPIYKHLLHCIYLCLSLPFLAFTIKAQPNNDGSIFQADPTIFKHHGVYYLYGTNDEDASKGFQVYRSKNLVDWEGPVGVNDGYALKGDAFGSWGFWAPQVWEENDVFYMAYTANEHIAIATSSSPLGPFKQTEKRPLITDGKQIDPYIFKDSDGKKYLFHVRLQDGNRIYVAELLPDYSGIKTETLTEVLHATLPWENTTKDVWSVTEGPTVVKRGHYYYLFYSANDFRNPKYAVGVAVAEHIYGPWHKVGTEAFLGQHTSGWAGTGHGDVLKDNNNWYYVCHTHYALEQPVPRRSAIVPFKFKERNGTYSLPVFEGSKIKHLKKKEIHATENTYHNPVFEPILADPTVVRQEASGYFYAYGTQDDWGDGAGSRLVPILRSTDLMKWTVVGQAFASMPDWKTKGGIWAPDVVYLNSNYLLYYAYSTWGDHNPGIGVAIATTPQGPFVDKGKLFDSKGIDVPNSIDPFFFRENNQNYLFWGSFSQETTQGTYGVPLSVDGLHVPDLKRKFKIAAGDFEAVMIHKRKGYYYFFGSKGSCCEGINSTYHVLVARSKSLHGPYLDKEGRDIVERGHGSLLLHGSDRFVGNGHNARIMTDDNGKDWLLYHGIDRQQGQVASGTTRRVLLLDQVVWKNGWPEIEGGVPSNTANEVPYFKAKQKKK